MSSLTLPFSYPGTKVNMRGVLLPLIEQFPRRLYVEPFCGAGGLFFGKPQERAEILNDSNRAIINVFKSLQDDAILSEVYYLLSTTPKSRARWYELKPIVLKYMKGQDFTHEKIDAGLESRDDNIVAAFAFLYVQNTCYRGTGIADSYSGGSKGKDSAKGLEAFNRAKQLLFYFAQRLKTVELECLDALECIRKYDHEETFFFIDPPYNCRIGEKYRAGWNEEKETALVDLLSNCRASYVLTCYDTSNYESLLKHGAQCVEYKKKVSCCPQDKKKPEVIETIYYKGSEVKSLLND